MKSFYQDVLEKILSKKIIGQEQQILIIAGGKKDRDVFHSCGFRHVVISNLEYDRGIKDYHPFEWKNEDAENLSFENNAFDWVFVHAGLHHCASPHVALCEMMRVAKLGVGVFESRDSFLNSIANKLGLAPDYELEPCVLSNGKFGGHRNSHIPNFVYKWTENEVKKTINSFMPGYKHEFHFYYGLLVPIERLDMSKSWVKRKLTMLGKYLVPIFTFFFKKQGNLFAFIVLKNKELQPWLKINEDQIVFDLAYAQKKYTPENYFESI